MKKKSIFEQGKQSAIKIVCGTTPESKDSSLPDNLVTNLTKNPFNERDVVGNSSGDHLVEGSVFTRQKPKESWTREPKTPVKAQGIIQRLEDKQKSSSQVNEVAYSQGQIHEQPSEMIVMSKSVSRAATF